MIEEGGGGWDEVVNLGFHRHQPPDLRLLLTRLDSKTKTHVVPARRRRAGIVTRRKEKLLVGISHRSNYHLCVSFSASHPRDVGPSARGFPFCLFLFLSPTLIFVSLAFVRGCYRIR